ncbi:MAG: hypothetical protein Q8L51_03700 [Candidatus Amesbacteria bacterium]|nr:hypothetical protein [Candidatus Amesbacteria bacterium]
MSIKNRKRPIISLIITLIGWLGIGSLVWYIPPSNLGVEIVVMIALSMVVFMTLSWLIGNTKKGLIFSAVVIILLIMRRLNILDWLNFGLVLGILGLINLII